MRDTRKEPLPGLCPRPQDFRRHISGVRWPAMKTAPDNYHRQRPDASSAHRRPGYPSSGCVPAEPDSVSPGNHTLAPMSTSCKKPSAPEPCLKNPIAPGNGRRAGQKKAEKSKITHTIWRRPCFSYGVKRRLRRHRKVDSASISAHCGSQNALLHLPGPHQTAVAAA